MKPKNKKVNDTPDKKNKMAPGQKLYIALAMAGVGAAIAISALSTRWGYRSPCAWLPRDEYQRQFYVYLSPVGGDTKVYRVPARIRAYTYTNGEYREHFYAILYAVMQNGGTIDFNTGGNKSLQTGRRIGLTDKQGRKWLIELTCDPAE
jgi:hypothetical protein